jgi:molecular chaperone GrpE
MTDKNKKDLDLEDLDLETQEGETLDEINSSTLDIGYLIELQNQNNALQEQITQLKEGVLRTQAESENLRKRYEKQLSEARDYSISNFAKELLGVVDNINRAIEHLPEEMEEPLKSMAIGIRMTKEELEAVLSRQGILVVKPKIGDAFDHNLHQVISQIESDSHDVGAIINIPQLGYTINGRLLRPASVILAK